MRTLGLPGILGSAKAGARNKHSSVCGVAYAVLGLLWLACFSMGLWLQIDRQRAFGGFGKGVLVTARVQELKGALANDRVVLVDSSSSSADPVKAQARSHFGRVPEGEFLMLERFAKRELALFEGREIGTAIRRLQADVFARERPLWPPVAIVGLTTLGYLAFGLRRLATGSLLPAGLAVLAALSASQFAAACRTCPAQASELGVPLGQLGIYYFGTLSLAALASGAAGAFLAVLGLATSLMWQLKLYSTLPASCPWCAAILALGALLLGGAVRLSSNASTRRDGANLWSRRLSVGVVAVAMASPLWIQHNVGADAKRLPASATRSLTVGTSVGELPFGGAVVKVLDKPVVLVLGTSTCAPCRNALRWAALNYPDRYHACSIYGQLTDQTDPFASSWLHDIGPRFASPTIAIVKDGAIAFVNEGWSEHPMMQESLKQRIDTALELNGGNEP